jgi:hypothetical protein
MNDERSRRFMGIMHGREAVDASHEPPPERGLAVRRRNTGFMGIMQFKRNWVLPMKRFLLLLLLPEGRAGA